MRSRVLLVPYAAWMVVLTAGFYALPAWHLVLWSALALSSAGAVVVGISIHRPAFVAPWWVLAATLLVFAAGDTTYNVLTTVLGQANPYPSLADVFYLAMYPLGAVGLLMLVHRRTRGRDRGSVLDALSLTVALALLSWIFLIDPHVRESGVDWLTRATSIAYPLGDVLLLATLARLAITCAGSCAALMLCVGAVGLLASDVLYGLGQLDGSWQIGSAYDLGWVVFYIAWGAAALDPSMAELTSPVRRPAGELSLHRVALLMAASLVAPGALLVDALTGDVQYGPMIAVSSAVFFLLVLTRVSGVVARYGRLVERERVLRSLAVDLGKVSGADEMITVVDAAMTRLVGPDRPWRTALLEQVPDVLRRRLAADPTMVSWLVAADAFDDGAAPVLAGPTTVLAFPLALQGSRAAQPTPECLLIACEEAVLVDLRSALEVLASQTALTVERLALAQEINERNNEAYFRTLVHNAHDVILIIDDRGRVRYASPSAWTVIGPPSVVGRDFLDLVDPADREVVRGTLAVPGDTGRAAGGPQDYRVVRSDGSRIHVEVIRRDLRLDPTVSGVVLTLRDVTEQRRLQRELTHRAYHDPLTGLANRALFRDSVERALLDLRSDQHVVGVLLVDLDDFKLVNDTMGHEAGDDLLIAVATRLTDVLDGSGVAARLGGDEFAVLVDGSSRPGDVDALAERVVSALGKPMESAGGLTVTVSVGVASTPEATGSTEMLRHADLALYAAKEDGKGQWRRYSQSLHLAAVDRFEVRSELQRALEAGGLDLHYQPIVDLSRSRLVGLEALVRWHHVRRGPVAPVEFIAAAEETGLIVPLGGWVLDRALSDLSGFRRAAPHLDLSVNVNVSAREIRTPGFATRVLDRLARWGLPGDCLIVEITETGLLADDAHILSDLEELRGRGVRIALDDFGTGYSSLDYVRRHALDVLKIDKSFTEGIDGSHRQIALITAIVGLARSLGLKVVAEGIETRAERDALVTAGCEFGQGFLFSTAVPAESIAKCLVGDRLGKHWASTSETGEIDLGEGVDGLPWDRGAFPTA